MCTLYYYLLWPQTDMFRLFISLLQTWLMGYLVSMLPQTHTLTPHTRVSDQCNWCQCISQISAPMHTHLFASVTEYILRYCVGAFFIFCRLLSKYDYFVLVNRKTKVSILQVTSFGIKTPNLLSEWYTTVSASDHVH